MTDDIIERLRASICGDRCKAMLAASGCECAEAADTIATLRKQLDDAREALVKNQWELETIDRTQSTNFRRVQELILANREALKGKS